MKQNYACSACKCKCSLLQICFSVFFQCVPPAECNIATADIFHPRQHKDQTPPAPPFTEFIPFCQPLAPVLQKIKSDIAPLR